MPICANIASHKLLTRCQLSKYGLVLFEHVIIHYIEVVECGAMGSMEISFNGLRDAVLSPLMSIVEKKGANTELG